MARQEAAAQPGDARRSGFSREAQSSKQISVGTDDALPNKFGPTEVGMGIGPVGANLFARGDVHPQSVYRLTGSPPE